MDNKQRIDVLKDQLNRILGFFPRVDAKASVVLGIDLALLTLLGSNAPPLRLLEGYMIFALLPVFLIGASLLYVYWQGFPRLEGGQQSLVYFWTIAERTEGKYAEEFLALNEETYIKDLMGQIWRNSEILKLKYSHLKTSFILLAWAIVPWFISLAMFVSKNTEAKTLLMK
jgi:hypothetical protein